MKILFTSEAVVEICNGKYHKTSFQPFIERYSSFGKVIFCAFCKNVEKSGQSVLDTSNVEFLFMEKETNPRTLIRARKRNIEKLEKAISECDTLAALHTTIPRVLASAVSTPSKPALVSWMYLRFLRSLLNRCLAKAREAIATSTSSRQESSFVHCWI